MTAKVQKLLNDSGVARWSALVLIALMMFFAYMFVDILSPLASVLNDTLGWDQGVFGTYASAEYILCVFGFLIFAGILLLVFGHGLNMILNVLSVIVHGVRLNTLEFSSHLGMSWSGFSYKPFGEK